MRGKAGTLTRIDPVTGQSLAEIRVGPPHGHRKINLSYDRYAAIVAGEGALWVIESRAEGNLIKVDPRTNQAVATIPLGTDSGAVMVGGGFVWVSGNRVVLKIDPRTNRILGRLVLQGPSIPMLSAGKDGLIASADSAQGFTRAVCFSKIPYSIGEPPTEKK